MLYEVITGYASLMTVVRFFGGMQLLSIGILGEYVGRMFLEVKQRPVYLLEGIYGQYARESQVERAQA